MDAFSSHLDPETAISWEGQAWRHLSPGFDPLSTRGAELHGGRWNPPGSSALYLATTPDVARAEFDRLVSLRAQAAADLHPRVLVAVEAEIGLVADLTDPAVLADLGVRPAGQDEMPIQACRSCGVRAAEAGLGALLAPSATGQGDVLVVFPGNLADSDRLMVVGSRSVDWT